MGFEKDRAVESFGGFVVFVNLTASVRLMAFR